MTLVELLELSAAIIISLGGGAAIVFAMSSWLAKVWAERILNKERSKYAEELEVFKSKLTLETESHKIKLKKSEFIFAKEFEAASALVSLVRDIAPRISRPEMDWDEACDEMAMSFEKTETLLHQFLSQHAAILPAEVVNLISISSGLASHNKFDASRFDVSTSANRAAGAMYGHLVEAESKMILKIQSQVSV
jgi:hypothetical protein